MPNITYIQPDGTRQTFEVATGLSVMRGAVDNGVAGIVAECGGACVCATCKVRVGSAWLAHLPPQEALEEAMLDDGEAQSCPEGTRRLSCQIEVGASLDGLEVNVPQSQY